VVLPSSASAGKRHPTALVPGRPRRTPNNECPFLWSASTVPKDLAAKQIVAAIQNVNPTCQVIVRCRNRATVAGLKSAVANAVVNEESEASGSLVRLLEGFGLFE
jgi:hypothetical protein